MPRRKGPSLEPLWRCLSHEPPLGHRLGGVCASVCLGAVTSLPLCTTEGVPNRAVFLLKRQLADVQPYCYSLSVSGFLIVTAACTAAYGMLALCTLRPANSGTRGHVTCSGRTAMKGSHAITQHLDTVSLVLFIFSILLLSLSIYKYINGNIR